MASIFKSLRRPSTKLTYNGLNYHSMCPQSTAMIVGIDYRAWEKHHKSYSVIFNEKQQQEYAVTDDDLERRRGKWMGEYCAREVYETLTRVRFLERNRIMLFTETPHDTDWVKRVKGFVTTPTKKHVIAGLKQMTKAIKGDDIYFYYFGHGTKGQHDGDEKTEYGILQTLNDKCDGKDALYENEIYNIVKTIKPGVNFRIILNCCYSGSMCGQIKNHAVCFTSQNKDVPSTYQYTDAFCAAVMGFSKTGSKLTNNALNETINEIIENEKNDVKSDIGRYDVKEVKWVPKNQGKGEYFPWTVNPQMFGPDHKYGDEKFLTGQKVSKTEREIVRDALKRQHDEEKIEKVLGHKREN
eukprot:190054_1